MKTLSHTSTEPLSPAPGAHSPIRSACQKISLPSTFWGGAEGDDLGPNSRLRLCSTSGFGISPPLFSRWFLFFIFLVTPGRIAKANERPATPPGQSTQGSQLAYDRAFQLLSDGKLIEALAEIDAALVQYPTTPSLHNLRGLVTGQLGRQNEAEASFRKVIELSPRAAMGYNNLGTLLLELKRQGEAEEYFREALKREPQNLTALRGLGVTLAASQKYQKAVVYLERAWRTHPGDFQTSYELARVLRELKRAAEARQVLERTAPPHNATLAAKYFVLSAVLAEDQGEPASAASLYLRAYELAPDSFEIYLSLVRISLSSVTPGSDLSLPAAPPRLSAEQHFAAGLLFASRNAYREALPHFEATLHMEPDSYSAAYNLALAYKHSGKTQAAMDLIELTLKSRPTSELHNLLASLEESAGRYLDAVRHFQQAVELEPTNEQYYFDLGLEYLAHFTFGPALEVFGVGSKKFPSSSRQHEGLGLVHYALRQYPQAADAFLAALEINPSSPSAYAAWNALHSLLGPAELENLLPRLQHLSGHYPKIAEPQYCYGLALLSQALASNKTDNFPLAQSLIEQAIHLKSNFSEAHLALGNLYMARKQNQKAVNEFLEAIRLNPQSEIAFYRLGQTYRNLEQLELAQQQLARYAELVRNRRKQMAQSRSAIKQFILAQSQSSAPRTP